MQKLFVGIDGGGSFTRVCVIDAYENIVAEHTFGTINVVGSSIDIVKDNCLKISERILKLYNENRKFKGICIGAAGVNSGIQKQIMTEFFGKGRFGSLKLTSDYEIAYKGNFDDGDGILLISGTGSVCIGRRAGIEYKTGGFGYRFGDEGSGYDIGRQIINYVLKAKDGRCQDTILSSLLFELKGFESFSELLNYIYNPSLKKSEVASLAEIIVPALKVDDSKAKEIVRSAANSLTELVFPVIRELGMMQGKIRLHGGVFQHIQPIRELVEKYIMAKHPDIDARYNKLNCAHIAAVLAARHEFE